MNPPQISPVQQNSVLQILDFTRSTESTELTELGSAVSSGVGENAVEDAPDADHHEGFTPSAVPDPFQNVFEIRREIVSFFQKFVYLLQGNRFDFDAGDFPGIFFLEFFHAQVVPFAVVEKSDGLHGVAVHRDMVEGTIPFRRGCALFEIGRASCRERVSLCV